MLLKTEIRRGRRLAGAAAVGLGAAVLLAWPGGTWLQGRERWVFPRANEATAGRRPEAVYLVAGERDQDRRVSAVASYLKAVAEAPGEGGHAADAIEVLTGHERAVGPYSHARHRNLQVGEWAVSKLGLLGVEAALVPGRFNGTDGEMAALALFLRERPEIRTLALCTSAYHVRRAVWRLRRHLDRDLDIVVVCATPRWSDRAPWTVLAELAKMARDALGLSRAPGLSRGAVRYPDDGTP